jgi:hypothetical protein
MSVIHIANNGLNVHIYETTMFVAAILLIAVIIILPIIALAIHIVLLITVIIKRAIKNYTQKSSGKFYMWKQKCKITSKKLRYFL